MPGHPFEPTEPGVESRALLPHSLQPDLVRQQGAMKSLSIVLDELLDTFARRCILVVVDVLRRVELVPNRPQASDRTVVEEGLKRVNVGEQQPFELMHLYVGEHRSIVSIASAPMNRLNQIVGRHGPFVSESVEVDQRRDCVVAVPQAPHIGCETLYGNVAATLRRAPCSADQHGCSVDTSVLQVDSQRRLDELLLGLAFDGYCQARHVTAVRREGSSARVRRG